MAMANALGIIGKKCGMTRIFKETGESVPVTVIHVMPNYISQQKTKATDGYDAIQIATGEMKQQRVTKPMAGHFKAAGVPAGHMLHEFRVTDAAAFEGENALKPGSELKVDIFAVGQIVDVTGISKGKGFSGTVKRHNFATQDATHGNSRSHRVPGSIGQNQSPGRVFKGKKMAGHLGNVQTTTQALEVVRIDAEQRVILVKGAIPGATGGYVVVKPTVKNRGKESKE